MTAAYDYVPWALHDSRGTLRVMVAMDLCSCCLRRQLAVNCLGGRAPFLGRQRAVQPSACSANPCTPVTPVLLPRDREYGAMKSYTLAPRSF